MKRPTLLLAAAAAAAACIPLALATAGSAANDHAADAAVCPGAPVDTARCHARVVTDARGNPMATTSPTGYGPAQIQAAYNLAGLSGSGRTVAIVDAYDNPKAEADLAVFSTTYGLPACTTANGCFKKVAQDGSTRYPRADQGWALEIALDVQAVHAACPDCKILLVEAKSNSFANLLAAEDWATSHGATAVSNSWGGNEFSSQTAYDTRFNKPGIAITASSGDNGYGVSYPASSPYVVAVGGTTLTLSGTTRLSETAWSGAGSGCSAYAPKPSWQTDSLCAKRTVSDVSAVADPNTGLSVYDSYGYSGQKGWFKVGGTSLSAPLVAAVYALAGGISGQAAAIPYAHTASLNDVTAGSNATSTASCGGTYLCTAVAGYDGPTGLGTPNGLGAF